LTSQAAGANARSYWQLFNASVFARAKYIERILPRGNRRNFEAWRKLGGKIFQTVHSEVDAFFSQRFFDLFCEHALGANFGQRDIGNLVAGRLDDFEFDSMSTLTQQGADVVGLPKRELRASGTYAEASHQARPLGPPG
jgi:hypothetical protein